MVAARDVRHSRASPACDMLPGQVGTEDGSYFFETIRQRPQAPLVAANGAPPCKLAQTMPARAAGPRSHEGARPCHVSLHTGLGARAASPSMNTR
jgi:hypothetical protein